MTEEQTKQLMRYHDGWYLPIIATLNGPNWKVVVTADGTEWNAYPSVPQNSAMHNGSFIDGGRLYPPRSFWEKLRGQDMLAAKSGKA